MTTNTISDNTPIEQSIENTKWYVLRVVSGKEKKVKEFLEKEVQKKNWSAHIKQILLPTEKVYRVKNGKKTTKERNYYPGYLMMEIFNDKFHDDMREEIRNAANVMHFLGKQKPIALRIAEVNKMLGRVDEINQGISVMMEPYIIGENIKIIDGPFNDFNGAIEEINEEKKKVKVVVKIFGRATPVELNFVQIEKIN